MNTFRIKVLLFICVSTFKCIGTHAQGSVLHVKNTDKLRIDKVNTPNHQVKIDSIWRQAGYVFNSNQEIELRENESIEFTNKTTGRSQLRICGKDFVVTKTSSIDSYIREKIGAGKGRGGFTNFLEKYPWQMIEDTLIIPTSYLLDDNHAFILKTIPSNKILSPIPYDYTTNELVLSKKYFEKNSIFLEEGKMYQFRVEYWEGHDKSEAFTDKLFIHYIPKF